MATEIVGLFAVISCVDTAVNHPVQYKGDGHSAAAIYACYAEVSAAYLHTLATCSGLLAECRVSRCGRI